MTISLALPTYKEYGKCHFKTDDSKCLQTEEYYQRCIVIIKINNNRNLKLIKYVSKKAFYVTKTISQNPSNDFLYHIHRITTHTL
jgi:hypothetical protein